MNHIKVGGTSFSAGRHMHSGIDAQANTIRSPGLLRGGNVGVTACLALARARSLHTGFLHLAEQLCLK